MLSLVQTTMCRIAGLALVLAGLLKGYATVGTDSETGLDVDWSWVVIALGELAFGLWVLCGAFPEKTRWGIALVYVALFGLSLDKAIGGEASCGCFGSILVNPWYVAVFDAIVIGAVAWLPSSSVVPLSFRQIRFRVAGVIGLTFATALIIAGTKSWRSTRAESTSEEANQSLRLEVDPDRWKDQPFPLGQFMDIGPELAQGRWAVMLSKPQCQPCRVAIPRFVGAAYQMANQSSKVRLALVEVLSLPGEEEEGTTRRGAVCLRGRVIVDAPRIRQIRTPLFVSLNNGVVEKTTRSLESLFGDLQILPDGEIESESLLFPDYRKLRRELFLKEIACGPLALIAVLQAANVTLSQQQAESLLAEAGDKGIDMLRLKELAEGYGFHALGVATSTQELRRIGHHAIVHMNKVGFAAVTGFTKEGVILVKPLEPVGVLPDDLFARDFGKIGKALLISPRRIRPSELGIPDSGPSKSSVGASLRLSKNILSVGRLHRRSWKGELALSNEGSETLRIRDVSTSDSSFRASVGKDQLSPGESTVLRAEGTYSRLGPMNYAIQLETNDPNGMKIDVPVRGYSETPVCFVVPTARLPQMLPNQTAKVEIDMEISPGVDISRLIVKCPKESSFTAEFENKPQRPILRVGWKGATQLGWHHTQIEVVADASDDSIPAMLPCAAVVVPIVEVFPPSLTVGSGRKDVDTWNRTLKVEYKHVATKQPTIEWTNESVATIVSAIINKLDDQTYLIKLSGSRKDMNRAVGAGTVLKVNTGQGEVIGVPLWIEVPAK